jgi:LacI family transcriptional regulator
MNLKDKKQPVTMREIARLAGVSQSTVSRVLNGSPTVDPVLQATVLRVMEEHNYRPNISAQGLVRGRTHTIGILTRSVGSPFFGQVLLGVTDGLNGSGYSPVVSIGGALRTEDQEAFGLLRERQVDGLILQAWGELPDAHLRELAAETPLIVVGQNVPGLEGQCVYAKNFDAAYRLTSYLIECGHKHIAHISGHHAAPDTGERYNGYCQALTDHGLIVNPDLIVEGDYTEAGGTVATERLLARRKKHPFTAIFAANDQMALSARLALYRRGVDVPDEVSLVGFDDQTGSQYMIPPLTTIRQPAYHMGSVAAQAILALLEGRQLHIPQFPLELIVRESVARR